MTREYPGTPGKETVIQAEISKTTGAQAPIMLCSCGRTPMLVSLGYGLVRVSCTCGIQGANARTQRVAVNAWNESVTNRFLEGLR
ncbi:MAG: hypothetical protein AB7T74_04840 [Clostridia bacterium]